jgi:hypothetical protein
MPLPIAEKIVTKMRKDKERKSEIVIMVVWKICLLKKSGEIIGQVEELLGNKTSS